MYIARARVYACIFINYLYLIFNFKKTLNEIHTYITILLIYLKYTLENY